MNKFNLCIGSCITLLIAIYSFNSYAGDKTFLTVDALVENGYTLLPGEKILKIMNNNTIKVVDIETAATTVSEKNELTKGVDRKFVETKNDDTSLLLDARLMARAPALEGKIERRVAGDELIATDGVRTYHYRLYKKQEKIYAVRDIDHGNVFFEVVIK